MLRNFIVIAWRNLVRNKMHATINVLGLSIGISACLVIYLIVSHELSFNKKLNGYNRIYRVHSSFSGVFSGLNRGVPTAVAPAMEEQFTGLQAVAPVHIFSSKVIVTSDQEKKALEKQDGVVIINPEFFTVFNDYEWLAGSPAVLNKPSQVVLSESKAKTYFGSAELSAVIGKELIYRDSLSVTVAGVVKDLPFKTDIDFTDFISFSTIEKSWLAKKIPLNDWTSVNSSSQLFVLRDEQTTIEKIEAQMPQLIKTYKEHSDWDVDNNFTLQPLSDLHYNASTGIFDYSRAPAHLPTLTTMTVVAILLLIIGAINFINLETALALRRAKEVGVRKVMGSSRWTLISQFLMESFSITLIAVLVALPLTEFSLLFFKEFVPTGVSMNVVALLPALGVIIFVVGFLSGLYPAFALSSFLPAVALKNQITIAGKSSSSAFLRKSLIVFQFTIAQVLIIATLIVGTQINYLLTKDLGFTRDAIVYFDAPWYERIEKTKALRNELSKIPDIADLSMSSDAPTSHGWSSSTISYTDKEKIEINAYRKFGDTNYLPLYGIELIAGRNLLPSDTVKEFLINETLAKQLGFTDPQHAIGKEIEYSEQKAPIIGVVKDFHIQSLHSKVEPVILADESGSFTCFNIRLHQSPDKKMSESISKIEEAWKRIYPDAKIQVEFLDDTVKSLYKTEQRTSKLVQTATLLAIFISCMGLFGLASFSATQRTKEIGIRKVLGATVHSIVILLTKDFVALVLLAFVLAAPAAWVAGNMWLETYAYKIDVPLWLFIVTAMGAIVLAFVTVGYKTLKAAGSNPVESLRNE